MVVSAEPARAVYDILAVRAAADARWEASNFAFWGSLRFRVGTGALGIQMELPIIHAYVRSWRFHEAVAHMEERGVEINNVTPVDHDGADSMSLLEVD